MSKENFSLPDLSTSQETPKSSSNGGFFENMKANFLEGGLGAKLNPLQEKAKENLNPGEKPSQNFATKAIDGLRGFGSDIVNKFVRYV
jgi:hypothetical protein